MAARDEGLFPATGARATPSPRSCRLRGMDAVAWTVIGAAIAILVAVGASFRSLRDELRAQRDELRRQGEDVRQRIDAQGEDLRRRIDAQGEQMGLLRERMAHLEGLLEGLREAINGKRVA